MCLTETKISVARLFTRTYCRALTALRSQPEVTLTFNNKPGHDCTILNQLKVS